MDKPKIVDRKPIKVEVNKGEDQYWCACGLSSKQPFCDGSHKDTEFTPMKYDALESGKKYFCACKQTSGQPLCDGSHNNLD